MIVGYHLIFTAYGWWLPNDPRGSSSNTIRSDLLAQLGELHHGRKHVQPSGSEIGHFYDAAKEVLKHDLRMFDEPARDVIAEAFGQVTGKRGYTCYGCAIMPDHVHLLIRKHRDPAEQMIEHLQKTSRESLIEQRVYPEDHPVWGGAGWAVYLNTAGDIARTVSYIERNPVPYGMPRQHYDFVNDYDGWDLSGAAR